jgi:hypothetical protein
MTSSLLALIWWFGTRDHRLVDKDIPSPFHKRGHGKSSFDSSRIYYFYHSSFFDLNIAQYLWLIIAALNIAVKGNIGTGLID